ncbi:MAG TPA: PQQ-dependent sugar dehydrogenase [Solirubrobacterales bacterium]
MTAASLRRTAAAILASACAALALGVAPASADPALPEGFQDTVAIANLDEPTTFRFAPDGRVFIAEKSGKILVYENLQDETSEVFADLRTDVYDRGDRGILGMVLDPEFPTKPYVYVLYTYDHILGDPNPPPKWGEPPNYSGDPCPEPKGADDCLVSGRLVRLTAENGENHAEESGGKILQKVLAEGWCQQFSSHSIGDLQFGPEGDLYASGGEGASFLNPDYGEEGTPPNPCGDPPSLVGTADEPPTAEGGSLRSQNLHNLSGKLIRIDPETGQAAAGNPLSASLDPTTRKIIGYGFRNPFRFTIDPSNGEIYVDNVGSSVFEEIDRFPGLPTSPYNSGWPCYEGPERQFQFKELGLDVCENLYAAEPGSTSQPFYYYNHAQPVVSEDECPTEYGSALSGISFYEGESFPAKYKGALFFADSVRSCIWVMFRGPDGPDPATTTRFMSEARIYPGIDIQEGPGGDLYYVDLFGDETAGPGALHRIAYNPGTPTARLSANPPYGATLPLKVTFDASRSSDPESETLEYDWDLNGDGTFETLNAGDTQELEFTEEELEEEEAHGESLNKVVAVRVTDEHGHSSVARVTVYPGDEPPTATIEEPHADYQWPAGDPLYFAGDGKNFKGEHLETAAFYWNMRLAHCPNLSEPTNCHKHPLDTFSGVEEGEFVVPEHDYPSYLEINLRVTDERGLTTSKTLKLQPRTVQFQIESEPPGIPITAGLFSQPAPFGFTVIQGSHQVLSAPQTAQPGGTTYNWTGWSDGGARVHSVTVGEEDATYVAAYSPAAAAGGGGEEGGGGGGGSSKSLGVKLKGHPAKRTKSRTARFVFSTADGLAGYRCKLDKGSYRTCRSPKAYKHLKPGKHSFTVIASDGGTDGKPVTFAWKVVR